jgi:hypothetical protein
VAIAGFAFIAKHQLTPKTLAFQITESSLLRLWSEDQVVDCYAL